MSQKTAFDSALFLIQRSKDKAEYQNSLVYLIGDYSELKDMAKATKCISLIPKKPLEDQSTVSCMAFAQYYEAAGDDDSAIIYSKRILDDGTDIYNMYDASKLLFHIYQNKGDINNACNYADKYMSLSDSIDFGERQELAATVNNEFQYHLDKSKEETLNDKVVSYRHKIIIFSFGIVFILCVAYVFYVKKRSKNLEKVLALSSELQRINDEDKRLRLDIEQKEEELRKSKETLDNYSGELNNVKKELERVNKELDAYSEALNEKEQQLSDKTEQNKNFIKLLHKSKLEENAEEVIRTIKETSIGKKDMDLLDWKRLYMATDKLYPLFKDRLVKELGTFNEQQMQVCYLMRIGLSKNQIQNLTNLSRVTIWRWEKKYDWIYSSDDECKLEF